MEKRVDTPSEIYERGKNILNLLEKYSVYMPTAEGDDKERLKQKLIRLNDAKEEIKNEIYKEVKEKSELNYSRKDKNPELLRKQYNEQIADFKKRKQELRLEKIRIEKYNKQKREQISQQFELACEKYKQMLDAGKITPELYESRIENMKQAKLKDGLDLGDKLIEVQDKSRKIDSEIDNINKKLEELNEKEIIYNEYGDVYYRLFGEVLADRNKMELTENATPDNGKNEKTSENNKVKNTVDENKGKANSESKTNNNFTNDNKVSIEQKVEEDNNEYEMKGPNKQIVITGKKMFNEIYKKLKKGSVEDSELNALVKALENPSNYDKYGITTGLVFNKAKKILKLQGARTAKNVEKFLRDNSVFNDDIKFDPSIEKDNVISHNILDSWKKIDEKLVYTDARFSVEKYIEQIEKYRADGNPLTKEQQDIYTKAMSIKNSINSYRKAINVNEEITTEREKADHNSIFYSMFKNKIKAESRRALPETSESRNTQGFMVMENNSLAGIGTMVTEPSEADLKPTATKETKNKEKIK